MAAPVALVPQPHPLLHLRPSWARLHSTSHPSRDRHCVATGACAGRGSRLGRGLAQHVLRHQLPLLLHLLLHQLLLHLHPHQLLLHHSFQPLHQLLQHHLEPEL